MAKQGNGWWNKLAKMKQLFPGGVPNKVQPFLDMLAKIAKHSNVDSRQPINGGNDDLRK